LPGQAKEEEEKMALSVRRVMLLVTVGLVMAAMLVAMAMPASATHKERALEQANEKACQGLVISLLATSNHPEGPFPPPIVAEALSEEDDVVDVKTYTKGVREGRFFVVSPTGDTFGCPREEE
jgi:hypothetical protein